MREATLASQEFNDPQKLVTARYKRPKWHHIYFLLAAFDLLTVSTALYLNHLILTIYTDSVEVNQEWAQRRNKYSELGQLAVAVNAPGNDLFKSLRDYHVFQSPYLARGR